MLQSLVSKTQKNARKMQWQANPMQASNTSSLPVNAYGNQTLLRAARNGGMPPVMPLRPSQAPMLQRKCAECEEEDKEQIQAKQDMATSRAPSLVVGPADDPAEREADRAAEQIMQMPEPAPAVLSAPNQINRKCTACEEEAAKTLQAKPAGVSQVGTEEAVASTTVQGTILKPGQPLDQDAQSFFGKRFGYDFSQVRVHSDEQSTASAKALHARAYTVGNHVVFSEKEYSPHTVIGKKLLAHELAHVIQQSSGNPQIQRQSEVEHGEEGPQAAGQLNGEQYGMVDLRHDITCSDPQALEISESFKPTTTAVLYSLPFHVPAGTTIKVELDAELDSSGNPNLGTVGFDVYQCCSVKDSRITPKQTIGGIGNPGHPAETKGEVKLSDKCTWSTKEGGDFVYYLRLSIRSNDAVRLSYKVKLN